MAAGFGHILKTRLGQENYQKLTSINNTELHRFVARYLALCHPAKVFISTNSPADIQYIREAAIKIVRR